MEMPKNHEDLMWHLVEEGDMPKDDKYILLAFDNYTIPLIGRCEGNEEEGYIFYAGDEDVPLTSYGLFVSAWMPLQEKEEA